MKWRQWIIPFVAGAICAVAAVALFQGRAGTPAALAQEEQSPVDVLREYLAAAKGYDVEAMEELAVPEGLYDLLNEEELNEVAYLVERAAAQLPLLGVAFGTVELGQPTVHGDAAAVPITHTIEAKTLVRLRRVNGRWHVDVADSLEAADDVLYMIPGSRRARETAFRGMLHQLRNSIGLFQAHNGCYPMQLSDLMRGANDPPAQGISHDGVTMVDIIAADWQGPYLDTPDGNLPVDPITGAADWAYKNAGVDVGNVHSTAEGTGLDGTQYSWW